MGILSSYKMGIARLSGNWGRRQKEPRPFQCWQIYCGNLQEIFDQTVKIISDKKAEIDKESPKTKTVIELDAVYNAISTIEENCFAATTYRKSMNDPIIRDLYQYGNYSVTYMDTDGSMISKHVKGFPCHYCGIVLPNAILQVDHQRPKSESSGGRTAAVAKVLRHHGFTLQPGKGAKANAGNLEILSQPHGAKRVKRGLYPKGRDTGGSHAFGSWDDDKQKRYTTTPDGAALISIFKALGIYDEFETACVNSNLNLVPACPACNVKRSDNWEII